MCSRKLFLSLFLSFALLLPFSICQAEVVLTDQEAQTVLTQIQESQKDLTALKEDYQQQKESYQKQLNEAKKETKKVVVANSISTAILGIALILAIIL